MESKISQFLTEIAEWTPLFSNFLSTYRYSDFNLKVDKKLIAAIGISVTFHQRTYSAPDNQFWSINPRMRSIFGPIFLTNRENFPINNGIDHPVISILTLLT